VFFQLQNLEESTIGISQTLTSTTTDNGK